MEARDAETTEGSREEERGEEEGRKRRRKRENRRERGEKEEKTWRLRAVCAKSARNCSKFLFV